MPGVVALVGCAALAGRAEFVALAGRAEFVALVGCAALVGRVLGVALAGCAALVGCVLGVALVDGAAFVALVGRVFGVARVCACASAWAGPAALSLVPGFAAREGAEGSGVVAQAGCATPSPVRASAESRSRGLIVLLDYHGEGPRLEGRQAVFFVPSWPRLGHPSRHGGPLPQGLPREHPVHSALE
ncbi:hypothetical protein WA016_04051 [Myxococcus stipitatus]